jgi:acetyl esterase
MTNPLRHRAEALVLRALAGLPPVLIRRLAGRPLLLDGQVLDAETQWLLRVKKLLREPSVESLPIPEGRAVMRRESILAGGRQPIGAVRELTVPGADGPIPARLYVPRSRMGRARATADSSTADSSAAGSSAAGAPLLVHLHGGGMVYGDFDTYDASCRFLAERADALVLTIAYRLAPEHPFPAGLDDCWSAYQWATEHAEELGADPDRVAVGGDSAGGYLSAAVALRAARAGVPCRFQLLIYPVTDLAERSESRRLFGRGLYLTDEMIDISEKAYLADPALVRDPEVSVAYTEKIPEGLAPAYVVTAGFDPLRDEGEAWARRLADSGVDVTLKRYPGMIHGFFNIVGIGRSSRAAVAEVAAQLKAALHDAE